MRRFQALLPLLSLWLTASCGTPTFSLSVVVTGAGEVQFGGSAAPCTTNCVRRFKENAVVDLIAQDSYLWSFTRWAEECTGSTECSVKMTSDRVVHAEFEKLPTNDLTLEVIGDGNVQSTPAGISCPSLCSAEFVVNDDVVLDPTKVGSDDFKGWYGSCASALTGSCSIALNSDKSTLAAFSEPGEVWWVGTDGGAGGDLGYDVSVDSRGNVVAMGYFSGTIDLDGSILTAVGGTDFYLSKHDVAGNRLWTLQFGGFPEDVSFMEIDASDDIVIAGGFSGTFSEGSVDSAGQADLYMMKVSSAGQVLWSQTFGSTGYELLFAMAVDPARNIYVHAYCENTVDFGGGGFDCSATRPLVKFDPDGGYVATVRAFPFSAAVRDMGIDDAGNLWTVGTVSGTVNLGGNDLNGGTGSAGFVAKFDSAGSHVWSKVSATPSGTAAVDKIDVRGLEATVAGSTDNFVDWGGGPLSTVGGRDVYYTSFSAAGAQQVAAIYGGSADDFVTDLVVSPNGDITLTGQFRFNVDFGSTEVVSAGQQDVFVARFTSGGTPQWAVRFGGLLPDGPRGLAGDANGNVAVTGSFQGTADFGGGTRTVAGQTDLFLLRIGW